MSSNHQRKLTRHARYFSGMLRHDAVRHGYQIDDCGFVAVDEIIEKRSITFEDIQTIVDSDDKNRFQLQYINGKWYIRAVQGHSIPGINPGLIPVTDASEIPVVIHGTNSDAYAKISVTGLNKMSREYIHFSHGTPDDPTVISGMRKKSNVLIYIDVAKSMADGIKFYKSLNGVILSNGIDGRIDCKYFDRVEFTDQSCGDVI